MPMAAAEFLLDNRARDTFVLGQVSLIPDEWQVFLPNKFPTYITWERYEQNLSKIQANKTHAESLGHARSGAALLSGLLFCKQCGSRLTVRYIGEKRLSHLHLCTASE